MNELAPAAATMPMRPLADGPAMACVAPLWGEEPAGGAPAGDGPTAFAELLALLAGLAGEAPERAAGRQSAAAHALDSTKEEKTQEDERDAAASAPTFVVDAPTPWAPAAEPAKASADEPPAFDRISPVTGFTEQVTEPSLNQAQADPEALPPGAPPASAVAAPQSGARMPGGPQPLMQNEPVGSVAQPAPMAPATQEVAGGTNLPVSFGLRLEPRKDSESSSSTFAAGELGSGAAVSETVGPCKQPSDEGPAAGKVIEARRALAGTLIDGRTAAARAADGQGSTGRASETEPAAGEPRGPEQNLGTTDSGEREPNGPGAKAGKAGVQAAQTAGSEEGGPRGAAGKAQASHSTVLTSESRTEFRSDRSGAAPPAERTGAAQRAETLSPPEAPREVWLRIEPAGSGGGTKPAVALQVSERAGRIEVRVRTSDQALGEALRREVPGLVERLEQEGFRAAAIEQSGPAFPAAGGGLRIEQAAAAFEEEGSREASGRGGGNDAGHEQGQPSKGDEQGDPGPFVLEVSHWLLR